MPARRRISTRLQEKAAAPKGLPPPPVLPKAECPRTIIKVEKALKRTQSSQPTSIAKSSSHRLPHPRVKITFTSGGRVLSRAAPPSTPAPMAESAVAIRNNHMPTPALSEIPQRDCFQQLREDLHDLRRRLNPSLPPLNEMPPESPITLEEVRQRLQELRRQNELDRLRYEQDRIQRQRKHEFDQSYYEIRDRIGTLSRMSMLARSTTLQPGNIWKVDEVHNSLAGRCVSNMGYLTTKRRCCIGGDAIARPKPCTIL